MKAQGQYKPTITLLDVNGNVVTGGAAGFTIQLYLDGVLTAVAASVIEISGGRYFMNVTMPAAAGAVTIFLTHSTAFPSPNKFDGINTLADIDTVNAKVISPASFIPSTSGAVATPTLLTIDAYRQQSIVVTIVDGTGTPIPGTGYTNFRFTVRDKKHASFNQAITTGITWDAFGVLTIPIPENAPIFTPIDAAITAGLDFVQVQYDCAADQGGVAANTRNVIRGPLTMNRYESVA